MPKPRTLHENFSDCSRIAADISKYVDLEQPDMALHSARETLRLLLYIKSRWEPELKSGTKKNLVSARTQLDIIVRVLLEGNITDLDPGAKASLRMSAQRVSNLFAEELGLVTRIREGVEDNA